MAGIANPSLAEKRKARRVSVSITSRVRHSSFESAQVEISNLSFYGFSAEGPLAVKDGDYVSVDLPNIGLVRARVAWAEEGRFGGVFSSAVDVRKCVKPSA
jgi:hypothetical protein